MRIETGLGTIHEINTGAQAPQLLLTLAQMNKQLRSLAFTIYSPERGLEERRASSSSTSAADTIRDFLHHDGDQNEKWEILVDDLNAETLSEKIASLPANRALAIDSKCVLHDGSVRYIPMMDFKPPPNVSNLELITEFLKGVARKGVILASGASYHFYGFDLLDQVEWIRFMGSCLLAPYSDSRWIGHGLIAGSSALRISANERKQKIPFVREMVL